MVLDEEELDQILMLLSNPTRRKILAKLVTERHYPLQLSRELRISQQAITKHLKVMEQHGIVKSVSVRSGEGPPRKLYRTTKYFTVTIFMDPKMFDTRGREGTEVSTSTTDEDLEEIEDGFKKVLHTQNYKDRVRKIAKLLKKSEEDLEEIDRRRTMLLKTKSKILKEAYSLILELYPDYSHRAVLYAILENPDMDLRALSRALQMRESKVERVLEELSRDDIIPRNMKITSKSRRKGSKKSKVTVKVQKR